MCNLAVFVVVAVVGLFSVVAFFAAVDAGAALLLLQTRGKIPRVRVLSSVDYQ